VNLGLDHEESLIHAIGRSAQGASTSDDQALAPSTL
jgi:hypothetical protein